MSSSDSDFVLRLPRHALRIIGIAFAAGLLLFVLVWLVGRRRDAFYTTEPAATASASAPAGTDLPVPGADTGGASGMQAPNPNAIAGNTPAQPSPFDAANAPQPLNETPVQAQTPPPQAPAPVAAAAPPAQAAPAADTHLPTPIPGQNPPPEYPPSAMRRNETGHVLLRVQVDASGKPKDIDVVERSGTRALDRAAVDAVKQWHFTPAQQNGQPVAASVDIPFDFALQH